MSAVVDARSVDPVGDGTYALGLSLYHLNALAGDTFADGRGRWLASARRSNLAQVINLAESDLGEPRYVDTFVKAEYDVSDQTTVAAHALFAEDRIELNDNDETEFAKTTDRNVYLWATAEHQWSDELLGRALVALDHGGQGPQRHGGRPRGRDRRRGRPARLPQRAGQGRAGAGQRLPALAGGTGRLPGWRRSTPTPARSRRRPVIRSRTARRNPSCGTWRPSPTAPRPARSWRPAGG